MTDFQSTTHSNETRQQARSSPTKARQERVVGSIVLDADEQQPQQLMMMRTSSSSTTATTTARARRALRRWWRRGRSSSRGRSLLWRLFALWAVVPVRFVWIDRIGLGVGWVGWGGKVDRSIEPRGLPFPNPSRMTPHTRHTRHTHHITIKGSSLVPLWLLSLLLGRGGMGIGGGLRQLVLGGDASASSGGGNSMANDPCMQDQGRWTVWEEWRQCRQEQGQEGGGEEEEEGWLWAAPRHWEEEEEGEEASAVLVELGPNSKNDDGDGNGTDNDARRLRALRYTVRNALENLPVPWPVQVVTASDAVEAAVREAFVGEVGVGKIVVVRVAEDEAEEEEGEEVGGKSSGSSSTSDGQVRERVCVNGWCGRFVSEMTASPLPSLAY